MTEETDIDLPPSEGSLSDGMRIIADFVRTLPRKPGVYRMIAADGEVLYVGKARSLRSRVAAYTQPTRLATRLIRMVSATRTMEFAVTDSEAEARQMLAPMLQCPHAKDAEVRVEIVPTSMAEEYGESKLTLHLADMSSTAACR